MTDLRVVLDRNSVCMGDDVSSHQRTVDVEEGSTFGSVLAHALRDYQLPSVYGGAAWVAEIRTGSWGRDAAGISRSPTIHDVALVHVPEHARDMTVIPLNEYLLTEPVSMFVRQHDGAPLTLHFRYQSGGCAPYRLEDFSERYR